MVEMDNCGGWRVLEERERGGEREEEMIVVGGGGDDGVWGVVTWGTR